MLCSGTHRHCYVIYITKLLGCGPWLGGVHGRCCIHRLNHSFSNRFSPHFPTPGTIPPHCRPLRCIVSTSWNGLCHPLHCGKRVFF